MLQLFYDILMLRDTNQYTFHTICHEAHLRLLNLLKLVLSTSLAAFPSSLDHFTIPLLLATKFKLVSLVKRLLGSLALSDPFIVL